MNAILNLPFPIIVALLLVAWLIIRKLLYRWAERRFYRKHGARVAKVVKWIDGLGDDDKPDRLADQGRYGMVGSAKRTRHED